MYIYPWVFWVVTAAFRTFNVMVWRCVWEKGKNWDFRPWCITEVSENGVWELTIWTSINIDLVAYWFMALSAINLKTCSLLWLFNTKSCHSLPASQCLVFHFIHTHMYIQITQNRTHKNVKSRMCNIATPENIYQCLYW